MLKIPRCICYTQLDTVLSQVCNFFAWTSMASSSTCFSQPSVVASLPTNAKTLKLPQTSFLIFFFLNNKGWLKQKHSSKINFAKAFSIYSPGDGAFGAIEQNKSCTIKPQTLKNSRNMNSVFCFKPVSSATTISHRRYTKSSVIFLLIVLGSLLDHLG